MILFRFCLYSFNHSKAIKQLPIAHSIIIAIFIASFIDKIALYFGLPLVIVLCIIFLAYSFIIYPYKYDEDKWNLQ